MESRRVLIRALPFLLPLAIVLVAVGWVLPVLVKPPNLTYHFWGNRPVTFYPDLPQQSSSPDYYVSFRSNSLGFNDVEHAEKKAPGVLRLLLLGDSYVESVGVEPAKHMGRILEREALRRGLKLEVLAMGMSGYGQAHHLATYETVGWKFNPDMVFTFFCSNDLWNNLLDQNTRQGRPIYLPDQAGGLRFRLEGLKENKPAARRMQEAKQRSLFAGYFAIKYLIKRSLALWTASAQALAAAQSANGASVVEDNAEEERQQWETFRQITARMKEVIVVRDGHPLVNVLVSSNLHHDPYPTFKGVLDRVTATFAEQGVESINLDHQFRERAKREGRYPSWPTDPHWNATGQEWVAQALLAYLETLSLVPPAPPTEATASAFPLPPSP